MYITLQVGNNKKRGANVPNCACASRLALLLLTHEFVDRINTFATLDHERAIGHTNKLDTHGPTNQLVFGFRFSFHKANQFKLTSPIIRLELIKRGQCPLRDNPHDYFSRGRLSPRHCREAIAATPPRNEGRQVASICPIWQANDSQAR